MLRSIGQFIRRVLEALIGLALVAGALALGIIVAIGLLLRVAWLRHRAGRATARRRTGAGAGAGAGAAHGDIIDVEARETREARSGPYGFITATDPPASVLRRP